MASRGARSGSPHRITHLGEGCTARVDGRVVRRSLALGLTAPVTPARAALVTDVAHLRLLAALYPDVGPLRPLAALYTDVERRLADEAHAGSNVVAGDFSTGARAESEAFSESER